MPPFASEMTRDCPEHAALNGTWHPSLRQALHRSPAPCGIGSGRELRGRRKDDCAFPVEIGHSPLPARRGDRAKVAVSIRDITRRKEQEAAPKLAKVEPAAQMKSPTLAP